MVDDEWDDMVVEWNDDDDDDDDDVDDCVGDGLGMDDIGA